MRLKKKKARLTESAVMTSEGGTKRSFSPFLTFFKATSPLSPTSTFSMAIFWGGRPDSDNHLCREDAVSSESFSQPHGMVLVSIITTEVWAPFSPAETEQWIWCLRDTVSWYGPRWVWVLWIVGLKPGTRVVHIIPDPEASTMAVLGARNLILPAQKTGHDHS